MCDLQLPACLSLPSVALALQRIAVRVRQGGHDVPRADVVRRFRRSLKNFQVLYQDLRQFRTDAETAGGGTVKVTRRKAKPSVGAEQVGAALRRAAKVARKTARMYGIPIYVWENGKVVAKKP